jgi:hypothetical protein
MGYLKLIYDNDVIGIVEDQYDELVKSIRKPVDVEYQISNIHPNSWGRDWFRYGQFMRITGGFEKYRIEFEV